jgi:hypothetical protein
MKFIILYLSKESAPPPLRMAAAPMTREQAQLRSRLSFRLNLGFGSTPMLRKHADDWTVV